ncbi:MAG: hypothetical protein ACE1ZA_21185, partial [Pseudomonadales bacterium]
MRREPRVRVAIAGNIYRLRATPIDDPKMRVAILHERGYLYAWNGITVFKFAATENVMLEHDPCVGFLARLRCALTRQNPRCASREPL